MYFRFKFKDKMLNVYIIICVKYKINFATIYIKKNFIY